MPVAPATAYTYFSSKNHLIAEVYLDLVRQVPCVTDVNVLMPIRGDFRARCTPGAVAASRRNSKSARCARRRCSTAALTPRAAVVRDRIGARSTAVPIGDRTAPIPVPCRTSRWRAFLERSPPKPAAAPSPTTRSPIDSGYVGLTLAGANEPSTGGSE